MPAVSQPKAKTGDFFVDYKEKVFEDVHNPLKTIEISEITPNLPLFSAVPLTETFRQLR